MAPSRGQNRSQNAVNAPKPTPADGQTAKPRDNDKASPVIAQYLELKAVNPGYLLFYQLGDFFELFFDDAVLASERLGLTLTKRGTYQGKDIPMAGVPLKVADDYLQRAIKAGFRVAVVEQLEDPAEAKKRGSKAVVKRDVTRLVTPGTLTEDNLLDPGANNYLTAFFQNPTDADPRGKPGRHLFSLASLDLSTGEFLVSEVTEADFLGELTRLAPSELILSDAIHGETHIRNTLTGLSCAATPVPHSYYSSLSGEAALKAALNVAELDGFGDFTRGELAAIAALLKYVDLTQIGKAPLITPPRRTAKSAHMVIDAATRANLELIKSTRMTKKGSLFDAIDRTVTSPGARRLAAMISAPLNDTDAINQRLNAVEFFISNSAPRDAIRRIIRGTPDIARSLSRLTLGRGGPADLGAIRSGLLVAHQISGELLAFQPSHLPALTHQTSDKLTLAGGPLTQKLNLALEEDLPHQTRDGGFIRKEYNAALDEQRRLRDESRSILARLQADYRDKTGIKSLKIRHNNQFGFFVEVTSLNADQLLNAPLSETFHHRQTLANNVRFTTTELVETEGKITLAAERALSLEQQLFDELRDEVMANAHELTELAEALANLDVTLALALLAEEENYARPLVDDSLTFSSRAAATRLSSRLCALKNPARSSKMTAALASHPPRAQATIPPASGY